jgi:ribosomal protein L13E
VAFRAVATQQGIRLHIDTVVMQVSRAQTAVIYASALAAPPASELRRLSALVEKRAEKAMRGAS